jgi:hypothetical protein
MVIVLNESPDSVLRDVLHVLYQGVLYSQNVACFCGTCVNVSQSVSLRKVGPFLH